MGKWGRRGGVLGGIEGSPRKLLVLLELLSPLDFVDEGRAGPGRAAPAVAAAVDAAHCSSSTWRKSSLSRAASSAATPSGVVSAKSGRCSLDGLGNIPGGGGRAGFGRRKGVMRRVIVLI